MVLFTVEAISYMTIQVNFSVLRLGNLSVISGAIKQQEYSKMKQKYKLIKAMEKYYNQMLSRVI